MKAYMHLQNTGKGRFGGHPIQLTIAMIVKNEEKTLDKCLNSLKPLLDAVPSELIITDTGSTDNTVEIAKKYTDKILHFDWCGDFSAARNTGINAARGQWFMFIDGDEWFENTDEIINFFNSGECDKYGSATYIQRNYTNYDGKKYSDFDALRIFRFYNGMCFRHKIHESIPWVSPIKFLSDYVHHYGYVYGSEEERLAKHKRNFEPLKEEIEQDPYDLRAYDRIAVQCFVVKDYKKGLYYCQKGLDAEKSEGHHDKDFKTALSQQLVKAYAGLNDSKNVLASVEKYLAENPDENIIHLDFYRFGQIAAMDLKQYEKSVEFGKAYLKLYHKYIRNKLDKTILIHVTPLYNLPSEKQNVLREIIRDCLKCNMEDEAEEYLLMLDLSDPLSTKNDIMNYCIITAAKNRHWELVSAFYNKILETGKADRKQDFIVFTNDFIRRNKESSIKMSAALAGMDNDDDYVFLSKVRMAHEKGDEAEAEKDLNWLAKNKKEWDSSFSDVLYFAMLYKINVMSFLVKIDNDDLKYFAADMQTYHEDFVEIVTEYFKDYSFENAKGLYFTILLKERVILLKSVPDTEINDEEDYIKLFENYADETARYVHMLFRREMFLPANISALPRAYRFGYYMGEALKDRKRIDETGYLKNLRFALKAYPVMKEPISILLKKVKKDIKEKDDKAAEFASLAKKVKMQIEGLIQTGNLKEAGSITAQLARLMPNDTDVMRYCKITGIKPSMAELATNLPQ